MVKITITPTALVFGELSDEILLAVNALNLEVSNVAKGFSVKGTPKALYHLLLELARDFDIEIV